MNCRRVQDMLLLYLGRELDHGDASLVAAHLASCPQCRAQAEGLAETQELVETVVRSAVTAPAAVEARVMERVRAIAPPRRSWRPFTPPWSLRRRAALAAAAAALALAGYLAGQWHGARRTEPAVGARAEKPVRLSLSILGDDHRKYLANPQPAQVPGPDPRRVSLELTPVLGFPVAEVDLEPAGARLLGGRKCQAHGVPIAFLLYDWEGERVSLYQLDGRKLALPPLRTVRFRGRRFLTGEADGLSYVAWQSGAMGFVMVSGARPERVLPLACAASGIASAS